MDDPVLDPRLTQDLYRPVQGVALAHRARVDLHAGSQEAHGAAIQVELDLPPPDQLPGCRNSARIRHLGSPPAESPGA